MLRSAWLTILAWLIAGLLGVALWHTAGQMAVVRADLKTAQGAAKKTARASVYREKLRATTGALAASAGISVTTAAASAPEWRDTPVPQEVQDALAP